MAKLFKFYVLFLTVSHLCGCATMKREPVIRDRLPEKAEPDELNNTDIAQIKTQKQEEIPGRSEKNEPVSAKSFHDKFAGILNDFVNNKGMVDYKGLRREGIKLKALLEEFDSLDPNEYKSWKKEDKIAFWINAYNMHKLKVVSANYPIQSSSRFLRVLWGPADLRHIENKIAMYKFLVMDEEFTFKKVENRFLRGEFDDPRILLAITDACLSSPPLLNEPYYGDKLEEQLESQVRKFLSDPLAFKIDRQKNLVYLSAVFEVGRYGRQFLTKFEIDRKFKDHPPMTRAVLNFITNYVSENDASFLEVGNYSVKYMSYDWTINDDS